MHALEEGRKFERYRVLRHLGNGLSGTTYEAEDTILRRNVALKLIHPWSRLPDAARRQFFREMQSISSLTHPYLATTLDYGEVNGQIYVARRYIGTGTLLGSEGRYWFRPPLESTEAAYYIRQIAQALYFIHSCGYSHGSLTFSNVLVMRGPRQEHETDVNPFILADVGLVQFVRSFGQPQMSFIPVTAAPELSAKRATPASDQYALGVLLYFWLAGQPPFFGTPDEIEQAKQKEKITPLITLNTNITFEQEAVIRRAMSANPEDRYSSVLAFVDAFANRLTPANPEPVTAPLVQEIPILPSTPSPDLASPDEAEEPTNLPETPLPHAIMHDEIFQTTNAVTPSNKENVDLLLSEFQTNAPNTESPFMEIIDLLQGKEYSNNSFTNETNDAIQSEIITENPLQLEGADLFQSHDDARSVPVLEPEPASVPAMETEQEQQPEPVPQKEPDIPQPLPEPVPDPEPLPEHEPEPELQPVINPEPEVLPQSEPDIAQPLPVPTPSPDPVTRPEIEQEKEEKKEEPEPSQEPETTISVESISPRFIIHSPYVPEPYEAILELEEVSIGRAGSSHILLDKDAMVSRHHALVRQRDGFFVIADQRSISGVFVNGQKITTEREHLLIDGDSIKIGDYELLFRYKTLRHTSDLS